MKLRLDTNQMAGVQCECGAWDLLEDIAICVFLAGDHGFEQKWVLNSLAISSPERWICESAALNMPANWENSAVGTGLKRSVFIPIPKKGNAKECSNYQTVLLISHASKVILKILQSRLQQYVNCELPDVQAGFRKGRGTRDQIANIHWIIEKAREFQKNIYFCFIDYAKAFDCVDHKKLWKILKEMERPDPWPACWEICMQGRKQQLELDMEQETGSK